MLGSRTWIFGPLQNGIQISGELLVRQVCSDVNDDIVVQLLQERSWIRSGRVKVGGGGLDRRGHRDVDCFLLQRYLKSNLLGESQVTKGQWIDKRSQIQIPSRRSSFFNNCVALIYRCFCLPFEFVISLSMRIIKLKIEVI